MDDSNSSDHRVEALVGLASLLATIWVVKQPCTICGSKLTWNKDCLFDGKPVCGSCSTNHNAVVYKGTEIFPAGRCCAAHANHLQDAILKEQMVIDDQEREMVETERLRKMSSSVILYSKNFKGKIEAPKLAKRIETLLYADKDEAEVQLRIAALREGCTVVQEVEFIRDTDDSTYYVHSIWKASGII